MNHFQARSIAIGQMGLISAFDGAGEPCMMGLWVFGVTVGMQRYAAAAFALVAALLPGRASAVITNFHYHKWVVSGQKGLLGTSAELDLTCHVVQVKPPTVLSPPQYGTLLFSRSRDFPKFNLENPHYKCSFKKVPGIRVFYRSQLGFRGTDHLTIEDVAAGGDVNISAFDITVQ